jgi:hypothetical protein
MRTLLHIPFEKPFVTVAERVMWIRPVYGVGLGLALILLGRLVLEGRWRSLEIRLPMTAIIIYTVLQPFTGDLFVERYMFPVHVWLTVLMWRLMPPATTNFWPLLPFLLMGLKHGLN